MNKKVLVIHPHDPSTDFLQEVYKNHEDDPTWTILRDPGIPKDEIRRLIQVHDKIIMMGHGTAYGLLNPMVRGTFLIDSSFIPYLKKKECMSIWCYSDIFFERYHIPGFHTGMIISELDEAEFILERFSLDEEGIQKNMIHFSKILGECIEEEPEVMKEYVLRNYTGNDEITDFNRHSIKVLP